ncbi:4-carboxy-2-hydroxymuconate-6-semialdehyde dehydrogenase [Rosistilla oblonga]|uniref:Gfo/Idh/MocA family protein n=1 Tax=Rosistilla oblonga TaxID=2527990 RepID=UPI001189BFFA|nr:Gfo/Idh/MocA family oxidoreductase [Rosistilla oblonga]QDV11639.1 4-carboxy-2-hydroxymuconate-6-semialdehyde dehydrogenase [Rosistilla oblonga]
MTQATRRQFVASGLAAGAVATLPGRRANAALANDEINVGFISCGGRSNELMGYFEKVPGVNIAGLCDPDQARLSRTSRRFPKAQTWKDLRDLIASDSIDAVVVATCNHWHCLATIWAMEAGKDVYVEKPLSHSQWEGRQTVAAARKYDRICQVGTQQRSDPMQAEIQKYLHDDKALGAIQAVRVNRYGLRGSIGRRTEPLQIDKSVAYDLWLGPAQDEPIFRNNLQYDWHWDWNTGSGEMGNWGVHVLDDVRNNVFQDQVALPKQILGGGGRVVLGDAGQTPNVHFAYFDTGSIPVVIGLSNLPDKAGSKKSPAHPGPGSGYVVYCEGGRLEGQRGRAQAFDADGKKLASFKGSGGNVLHQANFIDAVRAHDRSLLNTEVAVGNDSTGWCNLANIAFRAGRPYSPQDAASVELPQWNTLIGEMDQHLKSHELSLDNSAIQMSHLLTLDEKTEQFVGDDADAANAFLKRKYREGYEVPTIQA